jgi:hypothetical protein
VKAPRRPGGGPIAYSVTADADAVAATQRPPASSRCDAATRQIAPPCSSDTMQRSAQEEAGIVAPRGGTHASR